MKLGSIKTTLAVSVFGISALFGASEINAQSRNQNDRFPSQVNEQRRDNPGMQDERNRNSYGRDDRNWERNARYKVYQNGKVFILEGRELEMLKQTILRGYEEGFQKGQFERKNRKRGGHYGSNGYGNINYQKDGKFGHQNSLDSRLMQFYFQKGFAEGYEDGFNTRKQRRWNQDWQHDNKGLSERELRQILKYERF